MREKPDPPMREGQPVTVRHRTDRSCVNRARGNHSTCGWRGSVHLFDRAQGLRLMSEACAKLEQARGTLPWR